jgi:hypothetical protein
VELPNDQVVRSCDSVYYDNVNYGVHDILGLLLLFANRSYSFYWRKRMETGRKQVLVVHSCLTQTSGLH